MLDTPVIDHAHTPAPARTDQPVMPFAPDHAAAAIVTALAGLAAAAAGAVALILAAAGVL